MRRSVSTKASSLLTLAALVFGGCESQSPTSRPSPPVSHGPAPTAIPGWNTSVRLCELEKDKWALVVAGGRGVSVYEASAPKEGAAVEFGPTTPLPSWNTSVVMAKMQNDRWYVVAAGGYMVAVTEALGSYSPGKPVVASDPIQIDGWNTSARKVQMQDGHTYLVVAGGEGLDVRPFSNCDSYPAERPN